MCMGGGGKPPKTYEPAAAPAPPLPVAEEPDIGDQRRKQNIKLFGKDTPSYRRRGEEDMTGRPDAATAKGGLRM